MIGWIVKAVLTPLTKLGEKYLDNQKDKERLKHGTDRIAIEAEASVRKVLLSSPLLRLPVFVVLMATATHYSAVIIDSVYPMEWLNPLELPEDIKIVYNAAMISMLGLGSYRTVLNWRR